MDEVARPGWAPYQDRADAGARLADAVGRLRLRRPLVLALPRGGVPVARVVADAIGAPLDVLLVRKIGAPGHRELGLGAIGEDDVEVLDRMRIVALGIAPEAVATVIAEERRELARRVERYRAERPGLGVAGRDAVIVDDGVATGGTAAAAIEIVRHRGARRVILAVPVGARRSLEDLGRVADRVVCPIEVEGSFAVGGWYRDFHQLTDEEVIGLLDPER